MLPTLYDGLFPLWCAYDNGFLLPGNREADKIITCTADSTGRVTDSFGTGNVQIDWIRRGTAGGTCSRYGYLSAVCGFGTDGIQAVGKSWDVVTILINENVYQKCSILSTMLHFYDTLVRDN